MLPPFHRQEYASCKNKILLKIVNLPFPTVTSKKSNSELRKKVICVGVYVYLVSLCPPGQGF